MPVHLCKNKLDGANLSAPDSVEQFSMQNHPSNVHRDHQVIWLCVNTHHLTVGQAHSVA